MCFTKTFSFTSPEKDFFLYIHGVISSPEKEKRSVLYYSDISDMFPVTGGNFIHTCMHVHIVFAGVRVCVRAGRRVCVCVKQIHTHSSRVFAGVAAGADSRACDICTHVITHNKGRSSIECLFTS